KARLTGIDWVQVGAGLDSHGAATLSGLLTATECQTLPALYPEGGLFRTRVIMSRHGFGRGEYKYFDYPLPQTVGSLRAALYARLAPIANRWNEHMGVGVRYPASHTDFIRRCHAAGQ